MARGFESKSVQEQWQDAEARQEQKRKKRLPRADVEKAKEREELLLSRTRIARELAETSSERRRDSLRAALAHLDSEIARVSGTGSPSSS